jgi:hypothetical protein
MTGYAYQCIDIFLLYWLGNESPLSFLTVLIDLSQRTQRHYLETKSVTGPVDLKQARRVMLIDTIHTLAFIEGNKERHCELGSAEGELLMDDLQERDGVGVP